MILVYQVFLVKYNIGEFYYVGPFSSENNMGLWLERKYRDMLGYEDIPLWTEAKEEMSFNEWAEMLIELEIINTTFELDSPE